MKSIGGYMFNEGLEGDNQVTNRHHGKPKSTCLLWVEYTWLCSWKKSDRIWTRCLMY